MKIKEVYLDLLKFKEKKNKNKTITILVISKMTSNQIFDLDKIKELTIPIEELQIQINQLNDSSKNIIKDIHILEDEFKDDELLSQIEIVKELLKNINVNLNLVSNSNLNKSKFQILPILPNKSQ